MTVHIGDAVVLSEGSDTFDVVVLDVSDPIEAARRPFIYEEFYDLVRQKLNPGGVLGDAERPGGTA